MRAFRLERHLTQEELAEKIDRSVETISNIERGLSVPSDATLHRLARVLKVPVDDLIVERITSRQNRPVEFFRAVEQLKMMDEPKLKLAYVILKAVANS